MKKALVTGITGQVASFLVDILLEDDYKVFGLIRRTSNDSKSRINHLLDRITLIDGDMTDEYSLVRALEKSEPDRVYNLAAQSLVPVSFDTPILTMETTGTSVLKILNAIKIVNPKIKFLQASSSEMYGKVREIPQTESTPFSPRSPYAIAKCVGYWATVLAREVTDPIFASNAISFNTESLSRPETFVTRKITSGIAKILRGETKELRLGNTKAKRDWSYAGDTAKAMHMILDHNVADDFVIASGETHSVEEFLELAFSYVDLKWQDYVVIDPALFRPAEVDLLLGDSSKIKTTLGWEPKVKFDELVKMMLEADLSANRK